MNQIKHILYAEDEQDIQDIAQIALEDIGGFQVTYCNNGEDVLNQASQQHPDLILLDVMMPKLDGPSTLQALRQIPTYASIPIIFMTAKIQPDELNKYRALGAIDIITKPFDPMTLAATITTIWERHYQSCPIKS